MPDMWEKPDSPLGCLATFLVMCAVIVLLAHLLIK